MKNHFWIDAGILISGTLTSVVPVIMLVDQIFKQKNFNFDKLTFSFLSNKDLFGKKTAIGFRRALIGFALFAMVYFELMTEKFGLEGYERMGRALSVFLIGLLLLAFIPHNNLPFKRKYWFHNCLRVMHNLVALVVFLALPDALFLYQFAFVDINPTLGNIGLIFGVISMLVSIVAFFRYKISGIFELMHMISMGAWILFTAIVVVFFA